MTDPGDILPRARLRVMQIIVGALIAGVCIFVAIVLFLVEVQNNGRGLAPRGDLPVVSLMAVVVLVLGAISGAVLAANITRAALRQIAAGTWTLPTGARPDAFPTDAGKLLAVRQTVMIVTLALLEGPAFMACIGYLLEGEGWVMGVVGMALAAMLVNFPTDSRVRAWLERQLERVAEMRQQGPGDSGR
jgi:hypothetical protein